MKLPLPVLRERYRTGHMFQRQVSYITAIPKLVLYCLLSKLRQERQTWQAEPVLICVWTPPAAFDLKDYAGLVWITASWWLLSCLINSLPLSCYPSQQLQGILDSQGVWLTLSFPWATWITMPTVEFYMGSTVSMTPKKVRHEMIKLNQTEMRHLNRIYTT